MSRYWKASMRIIAIILTVATFLTVVPLTIFAEEFEGDPPENTETSQQEPFDPSLPKEWRYEYNEKTAGAAGIVRLNEGTQRIEIIREEFALTNFSADLSLQRIFSQQKSSKLADYGVISSPYGNSWFTNFNNLLAFDDETGQYKYFDSNGDVRYFENMGSVAVGGKVQWNEVDQETLHLSGDVLWMPASKTDYENLNDIEIKSADDIVKKFDQLGRLVKLSYNKKELLIQYVGDSLIQIDKITDNNENEYLFEYSDGMLSIIGQAVYEYDDDGNFVCATTADENIASYEYNEQGFPSKVQGADDSYFAFAYDENARVVKISDYALIYVLPEIEEFPESTTEFEEETTTEESTTEPATAEETTTEPETSTEETTSIPEISDEVFSTEITTSEEESEEENESYTGEPLFPEETSSTGDEDELELALPQEFVEQEVIDIVLGDNYLVTFNSNRIDPITKLFDEYGRFWFNVSGSEPIGESEIIENPEEDEVWLNSQDGEDEKVTVPAWRQGTHPLQAGRAGTAIVNDATQTLTTVRHELSLPGNNMPVNIERHYSEENSVVAAEFGAIDSPYGKNWLLNYNRLIQYDSENEQYISLREDGTVIYYANLGQINSYGDAIWQEVSLEDRHPTETQIIVPGYVINSDNYTEIKLINKDKQVESFDAFGRLNSISNQAETPNSITIIYTSASKLAIEKIIDGVGREFRFTYAGGFLSSIQCYNADSEAIWVGGENKAPTVIENSPTESPEPPVIQETFTFNKNLADLNQVLVSSTGSGDHNGTYTNTYVSATAEYKFLTQSSHKTTLRYTDAKNAVESYLNATFPDWQNYTVSESLKIQAKVNNSALSVSGVNKVWTSLHGEPLQELLYVSNGSLGDGDYNVSSNNIQIWTKDQTPKDILVQVEGARNQATQTGHRTTSYVPNNGTSYVTFSGTVLVPNPNWHPPIENPPDIIDHGSKELKNEYIYDAYGNFVGATYLDGATVSYSYTDDGKLSELQNIDGKQLKYTYNQNGQVNTFGTYYQDDNQTLPGEI